MRPRRQQADPDRLVGLLREAAARGPATEALRAQIMRAVQQLGHAGVEALAASPHLAGLTTLDLSENQIGEAGARALAASPHLASLTRLTWWSATPGGIRPGRRRRQSEYALQLREKKKVRALYGVSEGQFRRYYTLATRQPGITGENLLRLLERRLDNVVYRLGFARSRPMARQLVSHRHIRIDGRAVNIPSYLVQPGQTISLTGAAATMPAVLEELRAARPVPAWLERAETSGRMLRWPQGDEIDVPANMELLLAFYSR